MLISTGAITPTQRNLETDVQPHHRRFLINYNRPSICWWNQIHPLQTSIIRDKYGNIVGVELLCTWFG
jgi:hypothetical protein